MKTLKPKQVCANCAFWNDDNRPDGDCRFRAPIPHPQAKEPSGWLSDTRPLWVRTKPGDFCGEWKFRGQLNDRKEAQAA